MKQGRQDLDEAVKNQKRVFFDSEPLSFENDDEALRKTPRKNWRLLSRSIFSSKDGVDEIKRALEKSYEKFDYE